MVWLLVLGTWQSYIDAARARGDAQELVELAACLPVDHEPAEVRAEALRGRRLSVEERKSTVWRELDVLTLGANDTGDAIRWPDPSERWPGELPLVTELEKRCGADTVATLAEELALIEAAPQTPVRRYHAAVLRYRLHRPFEVPSDPLPAELTVGRDVLIAERAFTRGEPVDFGALEAKLPLYRSELRLRQLQVALRSGDDAQIEVALDREVDEPFLSYFLAVRLLRLERAQNGSEILRLLDEHAPMLSRDENAEIVRSIASSALATAPFTRTTVARLEALYGKARALRELLRVGSFAVSKNQLTFARDAFAWLPAHSKAFAGRANAKLAAIGLLAGDLALLDKSLVALGEMEPKTLEHYEALLLVARSSAVGSREALSRVIAAVTKLRTKRPDLKRAAEIVTELQALQARGPKRFELVIPEASAPLSPFVPDVRFPLPEPFALVSLPAPLR